ncbi:MAG: hypothetical protein ACYCY2_03100 [Acidithiobacillus ferriphilus]
MSTIRYKPILDYIRASVHIKRARYISEGWHIIADDDFLPEITVSMLARYFPLMHTDYLNEKAKAVSEGVINADISFVCHREMAKNSLRKMRKNREAINLHFSDRNWSVDINKFAKQNRKDVQRGQTILATLYHEYGHSFFWQIAEYLEYGNADRIKIEVNKYGGGYAEQENPNRLIHDHFLDAVLSLAGIAAARFSAKGFRIFDYKDDTIHSKRCAIDDINSAKINLQLAGVPKHNVQKAVISIVEVLETFFALLHVFNYYDWQSQLLEDSESTLTCSQNEYDTGFVIYLEPDHYKVIFHYAKPDATLFSFINLRNLAEDIGASFTF